MEENSKWRWALVGNIVETHEYGEEHELRRGSKHFSAGTKVYVNPEYPGMGHIYIKVIGKPRGRGGLIEVALQRKLVTNFRLQKVYSPAVLRRMEGSPCGNKWWGDADKDRDEIIEWLDSLAPVAAQAAREKLKEDAHKEAK